MVVLRVTAPGVVLIDRGTTSYPRANETMIQAIAGVGPMTGLIASNAQRCRSDPKPVPCAGFVASGVVAFREIEKPTK